MATKLPVEHEEQGQTNCRRRPQIAPPSAALDPLRRRRRPRHRPKPPQRRSQPPSAAGHPKPKYCRRRPPPPQPRRRSHSPRRRLPSPPPSAAPTTSTQHRLRPRLGRNHPFFSEHEPLSIRPQPQAPFVDPQLVPQPTPSPRTPSPPCRPPSLGAPSSAASPRSTVLLRPRSTAVLQQPASSRSCFNLRQLLSPGSTFSTRLLYVLGMPLIRPLHQAVSCQLIHLPWTLPHLRPRPCPGTTSFTSQRTATLIWGRREYDATPSDI